MFIPFHHHHHHVPLDHDEWVGVKIFVMTILFLSFVALSVLVAMGRVHV